MKYKLATLFLVFLSPFYVKAQENKNVDFNFDGLFKTHITGYVFLKLDDDIVDSCLIVNNRFSFKGKLPKPIMTASIVRMDMETIMSRGFYLENANIEAEISIAIKKNDGKKLAVFQLDTIKGSPTEMLYQDYKAFEKRHQRDLDFFEQDLKKLDELAIANPNNPYVGVLLSGFTTNINYDKERLKVIYAKLNKESQSPYAVKLIEKTLYPESLVRLNDLVYDFQLPDRFEKVFDTKSLNGKWYLINFWASWNTPYRAQLPFLQKIYTTYKDKNFEVIGLSIDKVKEYWTDAIDDEHIKWINVNENKHFYGAVAKRYDVDAVPTNFLVNPEGRIVGKNVTMEGLEKILSERR